MSDNEEYLGFIEYNGDSIINGAFDAKKAAKALIGFDSCMKNYLGSQFQVLQKVDYELPVRIRKGSWQALIPQGIEQWVLASILATLTAYMGAAAAQMAQNDFKNIGLGTLFNKGLHGIQWFIRLVKHTGIPGQRKFENVRWRNNNTEIGVPNRNGEYLFIPKEFLDWISAAPTYLISDLAEIVSEGRNMSVGVYSGKKLIKETITPETRYLFSKVEEDEILFPELIHGMPVELEGEVTRGNENSNSIGFRFQDHILTCHPAEGNITRFKYALFLNCRIKGEVTRFDKQGGTNDPRPQILFDNLDVLEKPTQDLFNK